MHSSRMRNVRCSSCLLERRYLPRGIVCPGVSAQGVGGMLSAWGEGGRWLSRDDDERHGV